MPCGGCKKIKDGIRNTPGGRKILNIATGLTNLALRKKFPFTGERLEVCKGCEKGMFTKHKLICGVCHCWIQGKARVEDEKCPLGKWER